MQRLAALFGISLLTVLAAVAPARSDLAPPTLADLRAASFSGIPDLGPVTLRDGRWKGQPFEEGAASAPALRLSDRLYLSGDLDRDGLAEAVVHLAYSSGGTGSFGYLVVMARDSRGGIVERGIAELGDRVQIRAVRLEDAMVALDVLQPGPEDASCCPSQLATRRFGFEGKRFLERTAEVTGSASLAVLERGQWVLGGLSAAEPAPPLPPVSLTFDAERISGSGACNDYEGTVRQGETATSMLIGPLATTRKQCAAQAMELDKRYLAALQGAQGWAFDAGRLVITYRLGEEWGSLYFETPAAAALR